MAMAYQIQDASNPIAVVRFFADCVAEANRESDSNGWAADPACLIMFDKVREMLKARYPYYNGEPFDDRLSGPTWAAFGECRKAHETISARKES